MIQQFFFTSAEYQMKTGEQCFRSVQEIVEEPEVYILCLSTFWLW